MLHRMLGGLRRGFKANSLWTNTLTCGILLTGGDIIQQRIDQSLNASSSNNSYDYVRTGRMCAVGLSQGPPHHYWYIWLDRYLPKRDLRTVCFKILADQILAAPFFALTFFFGMGLLEDRRISEIWKEFLNKFPTIYIFDWCIWPPTQYINFKWVPPHFRVLYVNIVTLIWDVFLSFIKHIDEDEKNHRT
ncbi:mpv17-like protein 2 [Lepeophtheirus salmonis]|uniref:mpv17-like protein 2 n=1 Tax=Lepeophtheirus salmonis TaxID=72036 RepID=UPI001AE90871|nr:mpv17-like protein 2 [Lepeophtheirus salmonis]